MDTINSNIIKESKVNQWKNTSEVITWFKNIKKKNKTSFINFEVENFYSSISIELFTEAINYAKSITSIDDEQLSIIMQSRRTLLFYDNEPWVKKTGDENFDVTMGCNDGAELCETVGIYMLSKLKNIVNRENIGPY